MKPTETLAREKLPDGSELILSRRDGVYRLSLDGQELMASRQFESERQLAKLALEEIADRPAPRVLVGGLGFGYTLRAALDHLPKAAKVVISELFAFLIAAHRDPETGVGDLAGQPLEDLRVTAIVGDVRSLLGRPERFDGILLDVDNGPWAFTLPSNEHLYSANGLDRLRRSLTPGGVLAIWSAEPSPEFAQRMERAGFKIRIERVAARSGSRRRHSIFLGRAK
jgi:spermidine synthase